MSDQDPENQPQGEARPEEGHVSFVKRLHRRFGEAVDPKISLEEEASQQPGSGSSPATSQELVRRLVREIELGPRYHVKDEVARGGMGTIMRVWDEDLRRNLAMKVMHGRGVTEGESDMLSPAAVPCATSSARSGRSNGSPPVSTTSGRGAPNT